MDGAAIHRLCVLELVEPDAALDAAAAALTAPPAASEASAEDAEDARMRVLRLTRAASASRRRRPPCRRRERLDPRRLLAGGALPPLATAAVIAVLAGAIGAGAGVLGRHSTDRAVARLAADAAAATPGPPARAFAAAGYDPVRGEVVLFGGRGAENRLLGDTWTWDGNAWRLRYNTVGPSPRKAAAMAWDPSSRRLLLF